MTFNSLVVNKTKKTGYLKKVLGKGHIIISQNVIFPYYLTEKNPTCF